MSEQVWGAKWRSGVIGALCFKMFGKLHGVAMQALRREPDVASLYQVGTGILLADTGIWENSPDVDTVGVAEDAARKWKAYSKTSAGRAKVLGSLVKARHPLCGLKARTFSQVVDTLEGWIRQVGAIDVFQVTAKRVALVFALRGLHDSRLLVGKSLQSRASGLMAWGVYALLLGYPLGSTLPPRQAGDVCSYIVVLKNDNIAAIYVLYIAWGCKRLRPGLSWRQVSFSTMLAGAKKRSLRLGSGTLVQRFVLSDRLVLQVQRRSISLREQAEGGMVVTFFEMLLCVHSEECKTYVGSDKDALGLPPGVEASIWVSAKKCVAYRRMRSMENRPGGSVVAWNCRCSEGTPCVLGAIGHLTLDRLPGQLLWDFQPAEVLARTKRYLSLRHTT